MKTMTLNAEASSAAGDVDVRGFAYPLEPVRQRQRWRVDKSMAKLAQAQHAIAKTDDHIAQLQRTHDLQAEAIGRARELRLDPAAHQGALIYLTQLREQGRNLGELREAQIAERDRLRRECIAQQLRLEGLQRHKEDALTEFANEVRQRASVEQDRDWLSRSMTRSGHDRIRELAR